MDADLKIESSEVVGRRMADRFAAANAKTARSRQTKHEAYAIKATNREESIAAPAPQADAAADLGENS